MNNIMPVRVIQLPHAAGLPAYATPGAAGMDLFAAIERPFDLAPGRRAIIPTGLKLGLPPNHELQLRSRSGLALKHGVIVLNAPATIDEDFVGEIKVILLNTDPWEFFPITPGMRIAQAVLAPVVRVAWQEVETLEATQRGDGGFGSTGIAAQPTTDLKGWQ